MKKLMMALLLVALSVTSVAGVYADQAKNDELQKYVKSLYILGFPRPDKLEKLIADGADVNCQDNQGRTPLWNLINRVLPQNLLGGLVTLYKSPNINEDRFVKESADVLLKHGANVNLVDKSTKQSVLRLALRAHYFDLAEKIVNAGLDINMNDNDDYNALILAASYDYTGDVVRAVVSKGPDINYAAKKLRGMTALQVAALVGNYDAVVVLVENGADINMQNSEKRSALNFAFSCTGGNDAAYEIAEYLFIHGAVMDDSGDNSVQGLQKVAIANNNFGNYLMLNESGLASLSTLLTFVQYPVVQRSDVDNSSLTPDEKTLSYLMKSYLDQNYVPRHNRDQSVYGYRVKSVKIVQSGTNGALRLNVKAYALLQQTIEGSQQAKDRDGKPVSIPYYYRRYQQVNVDDMLFEVRCLKNDFDEWCLKKM
ncbi:MAG TPA: ankyrin repeat domain-containing protein [Spirochaetales bacterium]|nr:ankyrin repeat domain-containing protein [Spirochaetales bacterium]